MHPYKRIKINGKCKDEHRLVVERAIGRELLSSEIVHHIDGNKQNNDLSNLEVMSRSKHTTLHSLGKQMSETTRQKLSQKLKEVGQEPPYELKPVACYSLDGRFVAQFKSTREAERNGFNSQHISSCCKGKRKTHHGYIWKYADNL